jgi:hypothetical protein
LSRLGNDFVNGSRVPFVRVKGILHDTPRRQRDAFARNTSGRVAEMHVIGPRRERRSRIRSMGALSGLLTWVTRVNFVPGQF